MSCHFDVGASASCFSVRTTDGQRKGLFLWIMSIMFTYLAFRCAWKTCIKMLVLCCRSEVRDQEQITLFATACPLFRELSLRPCRGARSSQHRVPLALTVRLHIAKRKLGWEDETAASLLREQRWVVTNRRRTPGKAGSARAGSAPTRTAAHDWPPRVAVRPVVPGTHTGGEASLFQ